MRAADPEEREFLLAAALEAVRLAVRVSEVWNEMQEKPQQTKPNQKKPQPMHKPLSEHEGK